MECIKELFALHQDVDEEKLFAKLNFVCWGSGRIK